MATLTMMENRGAAGLIDAGPRVTKVWKPTALGALEGIALRTAGHARLG